MKTKAHFKKNIYIIFAVIMNALTNYLIFINASIKGDRWGALINTSSQMDIND